MKNLGSIGVIVAARMSSTRLPGKALKPVQGIPMLLFLLKRLKNSKYVDEIILATSLLDEDSVLADLAKKEKFSVYRGDLEDVTARYIAAARAFNVDTVVRVTGDCPLVNYELVDYCIEKALLSYPFDLCTTKGEFPVGLDVEIYSNSQLSSVYDKHKLTASQREHLTLYFYDNKEQFNIIKLVPPNYWKGSGQVYTVDDSYDYQMVSSLVDTFDDNTFSIRDIVESE